jgi:hypothetical protein
MKIKSERIVDRTGGYGCCMSSLPGNQSGQDQPPENAYKALNLNLMHLPIPPL